MPELELGTVFEEGNNNHKRQLQEENELLEEEEEGEEIEDKLTGNSRELKKFKVRLRTKNWSIEEAHPIH